jgi:hypothetical protein
LSFKSSGSFVTPITLVLHWPRGEIVGFGSTASYKFGFLATAWRHGARFYAHPWKHAIVAGDFEQGVATEHRGDGVGMAAFRAAMNSRARLMFCIWLYHFFPSRVRS